MNRKAVSILTAINIALFVLLLLAANLYRSYKDDFYADTNTLSRMSYALKQTQEIERHEKKLNTAISEYIEKRTFGSIVDAMTVISNLLESNKIVPKGMSQLKDKQSGMITVQLEESFSKTAECLEAIANCKKTLRIKDLTMKMRKGRLNTVFVLEVDLE